MDTEMIWGLIRVILALAIIVPCAVLAARWYGQRHVGGRDLEIKEVVSLGPNRALYVVAWEGKQLLLGVTTQSITLLGESPQPQPHVDQKEVQD